MTSPDNKENDGKESSFESFRSTWRSIQYGISCLFISEPLRPSFEKDILKIFEMSKNSILSATSDFTECRATDNHGLSEKIYPIPFGSCDEWDLKLGDYVKVMNSKHDFQRLQTAVVGWKPYHERLCGKIGVVGRVLNKYENSVRVDFPGFLNSNILYNGVLEKVPLALDLFGWQFQWRRGDYVKTYVKQRDLRYVAMGYPPIPRYLYGKRSRIVATYGHFVFVTFNEINAYSIDSSLLVLCDDKSPLDVPKTLSHPRGFEIGEKVKVVSDPQQLVLNQRKLSSLVWKLQMSRLRGQRATIVDIMDDGSVELQMTNCSSLLLNHESVLHLEEQDTYWDGLFCVYVGDFVRVKKYVAAEAIFDQNNISDSFWEYLQRHAIVKDVDADFNIYYINFGHGEDVPVHRSSIEKVFSFEKNNYHGAQHPLEFLRQGDLVHFDVGPPEFVRDVLRDTEKDKEISMDPVLILGYDTAYHIKIRFPDGKYYIVNEKHFAATSRV